MLDARSWAGESDNSLFPGNAIARPRHPLSPSDALPWSASYCIVYAGVNHHQSKPDKEKTMRNTWKIRAGYLLPILLAMTIACGVTACGASGKVFVKSPPSSGKGLIYVYRPGRILGAANTWYLSANGVRVTTVTNGGYFPIDSDPGNVTFSAKVRPGAFTLITALLSREQEMITINVQPGKLYFVKFDHKASGPYMELVDQSKGEAEIQGLHMFAPWKE